MEDRVNSGGTTYLDADGKELTKKEFDRLQNQENKGSDPDFAATKSSDKAQGTDPGAFKKGKEDKQ